jgi:hypothetical protein
MTSSRKSEALFQKGLILFFFGIAVAAFVYQLYLDNYYHLNGAREPVPAEGRIYREFVHHGSQVFLTKRSNSISTCCSPRLRSVVFSSAVFLLCVGNYLARTNRNLSGLLFVDTLMID